MQRLITTGHVVAGALAGQCVGGLLALGLVRGAGASGEGVGFAAVVLTATALFMVAGGVLGYRARQRHRGPSGGGLRSRWTRRRQAGGPAQSPALVRRPGGRPLSAAAATGAYFGLIATPIGAVVLMLCLSLAEATPGAGPGALIVGGILFGLFGAVLMAPTGAGLGAVFGLLNGAVARQTWGQGWGAVVAAGGLLFLPVLAVASSGGIESGDVAGLLGVGVVPAMASAAQLRYEQRRRQSPPALVPSPGT